MQHAGERPLGRFILQYGDHLVIGGPAMYDQGQTGFPGGGDMAAKQFCLNVTGALVVVKVETGFTNPHHLVMAGQLYQAVGAQVRLLGRAMGMQTDRAVDIIESLGNSQDIGETLDPGTDRDHRSDAGRRRPRHHAIQIFAQRGKIQMAMTIDQQAQASSSAPL